MKKLYQWISLAGAKLVGRRHNRDVDPPGLKELKNAFVSKSDAAITCRPDFNPVSESLEAYSASISFPAGSNEDDYLNSAFGMVGSSNSVFLSTYGQFNESGESLTALYATGTATTAAGSADVTIATASLIETVWPGCTIEFDDDGVLYVIRSVNSNTTLTLEKACASTHSGVAYSIRRCHGPENSNYKFNIQNFTTGIIYSCPTNTSPPAENKICGPFHANVTTTAEVVDTTVMDEFSDVVDTVASAATDPYLGSHSIANQSTLAIGMRLYKTDDGVTHVAQTSTLADPESWAEVVADPADFTISADACDIWSFYNYGTSAYGYVIGGTQTSTGDMAVAITYDLGASWSVLPHSSGTNGTVSRLCSVVADGGTTIFAYNAGTDDVYYTIDYFTTWTQCTGLDDIDDAGGDYVTAIRAGKAAFSEDVLTGTIPAEKTVIFVLTNNGDIFYSFYDTAASDLTSFTQFPTALSGSGWADVATNSYTQVNGTFNYRYSNILFVRRDPALSSGVNSLARLYTYYGFNSAVTPITYVSLGLDEITAVGYQGLSSLIYSCCLPNQSALSSSDFFLGGKIVAGDYLGEPFVINSINNGPSNNLFPSGSEDGHTDSMVLFGSPNKRRIATVHHEYNDVDPGTYIYSNIIKFNEGVVSSTTGNFEPLSTTIRSLTHSVLDGYVVMMSTYEYDTDTGVWVYYPRRIRWSTPLTFNDFTSIGSGSAEIDGSGVLLDSRPVNGRIVVFESSAIGALSPRGYASDPWEYDRIKDNIRAISNPVVVDDMCYFIDDSGLLRATNGITVDSPPFSFDLSEYDDFNADSPVWLTYSPEFESLVVFNPSDANRYIYMIETENGYVSRIQAATVLNGAGTDLTPKSIVCVENSSDRRMMVTYNPIVADTTELVCAELSTGETITGKDEWTSEAGDDTYHSTVFETGEIYLVPEGQKTSIKHIIVRTYTDGATTATNPVVAVQVRSLEDTAWHCPGDTNGTITVDTDSCDGTGTAWSNKLDSTSDPVYTTPCLATQARIYVGSTPKTAGTDYTITGTKEITFGAAAGGTVYAYWENVPEVKVEAGDLISSTNSYHLISSVTDQNSLVLSHYLPSGSDATAIHIPAERIPNGDGEVKIGLNKLVEGVRIRVIVMHDAGGDATVTKITGLVVGHTPCGTKVVEV